MAQYHHPLVLAHELYIRANTSANTTVAGDTSDPDHAKRPAAFKVVGISLAVASGVFIGISFVVKKAGLLRANVKYNEEAGEGYGYLKNWLWWTGMTLMIVGEICNFVAYAFVDAILVTPLGALSVVITTVLSAIFLKERLSLVGKIGCFLCIVGSVVILMNAPEEASAATIQEMKKFVIAPGFLSFAGVVIAGCLFAALWAGPRYGKKSMLVYISICSWIGGLSVVATQGLGAAIVTQIGGTAQFNQWFLYVLLVFVITTLVTEVIYLNKALNLFNAALVTPTYYVYFTSTTIITSAILFRGFKGTASSITTVVLGFLTICSGVVLLQLSKSAKDVPDAAVFSGDLDQVRTIVEQEQPESEPKADAIRGAAAILRRMSTARQKMEINEVKRLHEEKLMDLQPIREGEHIEWDGLRRRRTTITTNPSLRSRPSTQWPDDATIRPVSRMTTVSRSSARHPPLGMSRFPEEDGSRPQDLESRPDSSNSFGASLLGTIRSARRKSTLKSSRPTRNVGSVNFPLAVIDSPYKQDMTQNLGLPAALSKATSYNGQGNDRHVAFADGPSDDPAGSHGGYKELSAPVPVLSSPAAKRQFSFSFLRMGSSGSGESAESVTREGGKHKHARQTSAEMRKRAHHVATEEERLGLVHGDSRTSLGGSDESDSIDGSSADYSEDEYGRVSEKYHTRSPIGPQEDHLGGRSLMTSYTQRQDPTSSRTTQVQSAQSRFREMSGKDDDDEDEDDGNRYATGDARAERGRHHDETNSGGTSSGRVRGGGGGGAFI